jgi:hypothetical protein
MQRERERGTNKKKYKKNWVKIHGRNERHNFEGRKVKIFFNIPCLRPLVLLMRVVGLNVVICGVGARQSTSYACH